MNTTNFDALCDEYESKWKADERPDLCGFLARATDSQRPQLLRELLQIELWWRRAEAPPPSESEYQSRYPVDHAIVAEAFERLGQQLSEETKDPSNQLTASQPVAAMATYIVEEAEQQHARVSDDAPQTQFGRYRLLKELGRGGMGAVFLAHDEQLNRKVALKIPMFRESVREEMMARFYREARAAAALRDPGICPVYDVGEIDGQAFISMAFIEGRSLRDYTKAGKPHDVRKTARVIRRLAIAMSEAHRAGIVHRDLKPANIMMEDGRRPVIMDFGLAHSKTDTDSRLTGAGAILGTPTYMSPEQAAGETDSISTSTDIYSLGVIFYEMLAGRVPFEGNVMAVLTQIATADAKPLNEYGLQIDPVIESIVSRMMARTAEDRYPSMEDVVAELTAYLKEESPDAEKLEATESAEEGAAPKSQSLQSLSGAADSSVSGEIAVNQSTASQAAAGVDGNPRTTAKKRKRRPDVEISPAEFAEVFEPYDDERDGATATTHKSNRSQRNIHRKSGSRNVSSQSTGAFWPKVLGGIAAGIVVIGGLYFLLRGYTSDSTIAQPDVSTPTPTVAATGDGKTGSDTSGTAGPDSNPGETGVDANGAEAEMASASLVPSIGTSTPKPVMIAEPKESAAPKPETTAAEERQLVREFDTETIGKLAPLEIRDAPRPDHLPRFRFPVKSGQPLGDWAVVSRPAQVKNVLSWSIEPRRSPCNSGSVAVSRDGLIAASFNDGRVRLYDAEMRLIRIHAEHANGIGYNSKSVCFSPDGVWLAAGSVGTSVDAASKPETQEPAGKVVVWDVRSGQKVYEHATMFYVSPLSWSPDSSTLAIGGRLSIELHNLQAGTRQQMGVMDAYPSGRMAWSPTGDRLAVTYYGPGDLLRIYNTQTLQVVREIRKGVAGIHGGATIDWSPDGRWLAFNDGIYQVRIHETQNYTLERTLPAAEVRWLQFSPDSTQLLCISHNTANQVGTTEPTGTTAYDTRTWLPVAADPTLAGGGVWLSDSKQIVAYQRLLPWFHHVFGISITASDDGSRLATRRDYFKTNGYYGDSLFQIWDGETGNLLSDFHIEMPYGTRHYLLWQPGGSLIAFLNRRDGTHATALRLIDSTTGKVVHQLEGHTGKVWQVVWSPDGKQLASVGEDATCRIWDAETGQELTSLKHTKELCWLTWSADGKRIACASPFSDITVWGAKTWEQQRIFQTLKRTFGNPSYNNHTYCPFDFLKDSESLFVMDDADGFELANIKSGTILDAGKAVSYGGLGNSWGLSWSPDFKTMLAGGAGNESLRLFAPGQKTSRRIRYAADPTWLADSRRIVSGNGVASPVTGYDTRTGRRLGILLPQLPDHQWAMIGPDGNYIGSPNAADQLVVTAILTDGRCVTLTLDEFEQQYGWKNDPEKAQFLDTN